MIIMPAVFLGGLAVACLVFYIGYIMTLTALKRIAKRRKAALDRSRDLFPEDHLPNDLTEAEIGKTAALGGGLAVGLGVLLAFSISKEWGLLVWGILTIIGVLVGMFSFAMFGSRPLFPDNNKSGPGRDSPPGEDIFSEAARRRAAQTRQEITLIVSCENCAQKLRIPRQNGKLIITCPKCRHSFPYNPNPVWDPAGLRKIILAQWEKIRALLKRINLPRP